MTPYIPASRWERAYGLVMDAGERDFDWGPALASHARREASAMRSRAFGSHPPETTTKHERPTWCECNR